MEQTVGSNPHLRFEVEKVIGVSNDGCYQVQWSPSWVSKFHLVGCEHLIQEFLQQQTLKVEEGDNRLTHSLHVSVSGDVSAHECLNVPDSNPLRPDNDEWDPRVDENETLGICRNSEFHDMDEHYQPVGLNSFETEVVTNPSQPAFVGHLSNSLNHVENVTDIIATPGDGVQLSSDLNSAVMNIKTEECGQLTETPLLHLSSFEPSISSSKDKSRSADDMSQINDTHQTSFGIPTEDGDIDTQLTVSEISSNYLVDKLYTCQYCQKTFSQGKKLKRHLRSHTVAKPHECSQCTASFESRYHLTAHLRKHTGEKPFKCSHCEMRFSQKSNLKRHLRTHTGSKPVVVALGAPLLSQEPEMYTSLAV